MCIDCVITENISDKHEIYFKTLFRFFVSLASCSILIIFQYFSSFKADSLVNAADSLVIILFWKCNVIKSVKNPLGKRRLKRWKGDKKVDVEVILLWKLTRLVSRQLYYSCQKHG